MVNARRGDWGSVKADLSVFEGLGVTVDPREGSEYADKVIEGLGIRDAKRRPHLTAADRAAVEEVFRRKARGLWVEGTPRTTIRGVRHDVVTVGAPVRGAPIRLKATELQLVENQVREDVLRKQLVRGNSPWGSWAFPVAATHRVRKDVSLSITVGLMPELKGLSIISERRIASRENVWAACTSVCLMQCRDSIR